MKTILRTSIALLCIFTFASHAYSWQEYRQIEEVLFEGKDTSHKIIIKFNEDFHSCGWNKAVNIRLSDTGVDAFKTLTSVTLAATLAGKPLSVVTDGCDGDRAKGISLKIKP